MRLITTCILALLLSSHAIAQLTAEQILNKIEANMSADSRMVESRMTIQGRRTTQVITAKSYSVGVKKSFSEYLSPAREKGTKMLKLENQLWIYSPSSDRTIQISGHMLRQSMMGSDLSYEDMMDDRKITETYTASLSGEEQFNGVAVYVLELNAKVSDVAYAKRKMWVDKTKFIPLKEELYSAGGELLKQFEVLEVKQIGNRWFPVKMVYRDMLAKGDGTLFEILNIEFNPEIPEYIFTKAALKK